MTYDVYAAVDSFGHFSKNAAVTGVLRMLQAGVIVTNSVPIVMEMLMTTPIQRPEMYTLHLKFPTRRLSASWRARMKSSSYMIPHHLKSILLVLLKMFWLNEKFRLWMTSHKLTLYISTCLARTGNKPSLQEW